MGASGAGKSTLCSLFGGFPLNAKVDESTGYIFIEDASNPQENFQEPPKIAENWC
jgi:ABC-type thiamine transport system ATPase subunit